MNGMKIYIYKYGVGMGFCTRFYGVGCTLSIDIIDVLWKSKWIVLRTSSLNDTECMFVDR